MLPGRTSHILNREADSMPEVSFQNRTLLGRGEHFLSGEGRGPAHGPCTWAVFMELAAKTAECGASCRVDEGKLCLPHPLLVCPWSHGCPPRCPHLGLAMTRHGSALVSNPSPVQGRPCGLAHLCSRPPPPLNLFQKETKFILV